MGRGLLRHRQEPMGVDERVWGSWKAWAYVNNEPPGTRKAFADMMIETATPLRKASMFADTPASI